MILVKVCLSQSVDVLHAQTVKKGRCSSLSADCKSKIGDMRGDFRAILLAKSLPYTSKRPGEPLMARPVRE